MRTGRTVGMLEALLNNFDNDNDVTNISQAHTARNIKKDLNIVVRKLQEIQAFNRTSNKIHSTFKNLTTNIIRTIDEKALKEWMINNMAKLLH